MTDRRLPMELGIELDLHRADAARERLVSDQRRRRRVAQRARVEERLRSFVELFTSRRTPQTCCA
ncbi:MAG: hypothetical protein WD638_08090 [Nitriliruptoraceae bacterium]